MVRMLRLPVNPQIEKLVVTTSSYSVLERRRIRSTSPDCTYQLRLYPVEFTNKVPSERFKSIGPESHERENVLEVYKVSLSASIREVGVHESVSVGHVHTLVLKVKFP